MDSTNNGWWRQLAAMYQGLLFLDGHIVDPPAVAGEDRDGAGQVLEGARAGHRHPRARIRLDARRLRAGIAFSLFR